MQILREENPFDVRPATIGLTNIYHEQKSGKKKLVKVDKLTGIGARCRNLHKSLKVMATGPNQ